MTRDNSATEQAEQAAKDAEPQVPDTQELPPMLENTDSLEALMKKAAEQLQ